MSVKLTQVIKDKKVLIFALLFLFLLFIIGSGLTSSQVSYKECSKTSVGFIPLIDMAADQYYPNPDRPDKVNGGLYGNGINRLADDHPHLVMAGAANSNIVARDGNGNPSASGKVGFISIGMSNTSSEFSTFVRNANRSSLKRREVVIVDGAQAGKVASRWVSEAATWTTLADRIQAAGLSSQQVQVAWVKLTNMNPKPSDAYPVFVNKLRDDMAFIVKKLKTEYPNVQIVYLSSRIYAGYSLSPQSPEPFAYEGGFSNRFLIEDQINGGIVTGVNYENAPVLLWGPYIWADGTTPNSEGLVWECSDFTDDGVHPSSSGNAKVSAKLFNFFTTDSLASLWFSTTPAPTPTPLTTPTPTPTPSETPSPTPSVTPTPTPTPSPTPLPTPTPTPGGEPQDYVARWVFDEGSGSVAADASVNGNTLTLLNGATWSSGHSGYALSLDGSNDYATRNDADLIGEFPAKSTNASQHYTISAWVKIDRTGRNHAIVTKMGYKARGFDFYIDSSNRLSLEVYSGTWVSTIANSNTTLGANTWYHVAVAYDYQGTNSSIIKLYLNGVLDKTITNAVGPLVSNTQPLNIGWYSFYNWPFDGAIDDVRIYNRVLSDEEISLLASL